MQTQAFDLYNVFTKTAFNTARQITEINSRTFERLVERQVELSSDFLESAVKQSASHYMNAQKELTQDYADKVQKANKDTVKIITQAQDEVNSYLEEKLPASIEQVKAAVKDTAQEAASTTRSAVGNEAA